VLGRRGEPEAAARAFERAATAPGVIPGVWEELAGTRLDQGRFAEARAATERLLKLPANDAERRARQRQLDLCDSLLAVADLPAVLAGKERPTEASTLRALAEWCLKHKRLTATAAGCYGSAFSSRPSLADDLEAADRLDAARAAVLAGCGIGDVLAELGGEGRAALRKQALDWLTAEYNAWAERHSSGKPGDRTVAATA